MKILLADDHGLFRDSMAIWIQQLAEIDEIIFANDKESVLSNLSHDLDLIMLDLDMPNMNGSNSIVEFKSISSAPILVVSANKSPNIVKACFNAGAAGYICKLCDGKEILSAVHTVLKGRKYIPNIPLCNSIDISIELSKKQIKVLHLLGKGKTNQQIAEELFLSLGTVKQYVNNIFKVLNVENRTQAAKLAREEFLNLE